MSKIDDAAKKNQSNKTVKFIKLYVIPIAAVVSFIVIILSLIIPKISEILGQLDEINQSNAALVDKNILLANLEQLGNSINDVNLKLSSINQIAPSGTSEVVKFRDKITAIIKANNLDVTSQTLSENSTDSKTLGNVSVAGNILLQEVPFEFELSGTYSNIVRFINSLSTIDDFIIIKEMQLTAQNNAVLTSGKWDFKLNIVKYQFRDVKNSNLNKVYMNVDPTAKISKIIVDYINSRNLQQTNSGNTNSNSSSSSNTQ